MSRNERGFTLIEVLVALAILAVSLAVVFQIISSALDRARKDRDEATASALVQSLLARVGSEIPLREGERDGVYSNGFRWDVRIARYGTAEDRKAWPVDAFAVRAEVSWRDGTRTQTRALSTLRVAQP
ncbi:MAG TPA: type II secretion system protein [Rhizomicrobium sp.]|jgi:general secretion pathway protein I